MKASTGRRAWKYNEWRREIAYQVDSRHSRVKWIGPYEGGSRVAGRGGEQSGQSDAYLAGYSIMTICSKGEREGRRRRRSVRVPCTGSLCEPAGGSPRFAIN